jgi:hypothetical protein
VVEHRDERIIVETDRHRITGSLRLPADGYRSRLTDYLNASERFFLALTDVEVTILDGGAEVERREFVALSLRHIVLAMPADENGSGTGADAAAEAGAESSAASAPRA